jgi:hypothetical protein
MKKISTIFGTTPQLIKAAVLSRVLTDCAWLEKCTLHTGDMDVAPYGSGAAAEQISSIRQDAL